MFGRFPIRYRLTAWYSLSLALVLGLLAIASILAMRASMYRVVDVDLRYRLSGVEDFLGSLPTSGSGELADEIAHQSLLGVIFQLSDESGKLLFQSQPLINHHIDAPAPSVLGAPIVFREVISRGWPVRLAAQSISFRDRTLVVEVAQPLPIHYDSRREFESSLLISLPILVIVATFLGYWLSGRALGPVNQIVEEAQAIDLNRLSRRLSVPPARDELGRLSLTLNSMLDRIESSVTRITQFTADASHELRAPLTLIQAAAEYSLRRERSQAELTEAMEKILRESRRTSQLIHSLLLLARADSDEQILTCQAVRVTSALREAVDHGRQLAAGKNIKIGTDIEEAPIEVNGEMSLLQRLFLILIDNAIKYTPENGAVNVSLRSNGDYAQIEVVDTGIGIAAEDLPHVFDRFWRADKVRSRNMGGAGLGLSIAKWIVEKSGGTLRVESVVGQGSKFEIRLPKVQNG